MDRYAVFGHPVKHSKSPKIHAQFAKQTDQDLSYVAMELPLEGFMESARACFEDLNFKGANVTVPFKEQAFALVDELSPRAERCGAVNTLIKLADGRLRGDNTDGLGLVADLKFHKVELADKKILVIGAGGAVRGVLQPLLAENPAKVVIANRTVSKAEDLANDFADLGSVAASAISELNEAFDVVINGTSASLSGFCPVEDPNILAAGATCYDMMYGDKPTVFNAWAAEQGAKTIDGLGMLVEQAAEAFQLWRGVRPETEQVRADLR
ncbi:shikimate dehydrogenase [Salinibius halmophilus]|uniref:shikimate dehydrogenase n=1 Tax=Salinibius halmophilus TaxID=1853216 RepID=UPI000E66CD63|nr:shikimate dehydrogenase [Salinibius halmophilus]